jgi:hypothetical protein
VQLKVAILRLPVATTQQQQQRQQHQWMEWWAASSQQKMQLGQQQPQVCSRAPLQVLWLHQAQLLWVGWQHTSAAMRLLLQQARPAQLLELLLLLLLRTAPCRCCTRWVDISRRHLMQQQV